MAVAGKDIRRCVGRTSIDSRTDPTKCISIAVFRVAVDTATSTTTTTTHVLADFCTS
jgi:hypothetical protein